ncbi:MAG TPA: hypothetical protein VGI39_26910 [Polyangiaceae bacterium]|jgi:hypothetical protein
MRQLLRGFGAARSALALRLLALGLVACNAIAGIGEPILETDGGPDASANDGTAPDGNASPDTGASDGNEASTSPDGGSEDASEDMNAPDTNAPDANLPDTSTPPPPAAKPGFDMVTAGTYGKSAHFALIATVGESPGGNNVGKSSNFVLKAGVIAVTQPN